MRNFLTFDYLRHGNQRQKLAYREIEALQIQQLLAPFSPVLAGTVPIGIDVDSSDLDIICCVNDFDEFEKILKEHYGRFKGFKIERRSIRSHRYVLAQFHGEYFEIEVFGQTLPVLKQNAYRHMIVEHRLLLQKGKEFRREIVNLKQSGIKTDPAFAEALELKGDPYDAVLELETVALKEHT